MNNASLSQINTERSPNETLKRSFKIAGQFLTTLDEDAEAFTFQVFDDDKNRRDPTLATVLHGTLDDHWETLVRSNTRGAGIFVTVNVTDLKGRRKDNIVRVRALWQEADRGDEPALPFEPHITVESSPGKHHRYVLVDGAPLDEFDAVQQRLVDDYGSDPNAKDLSRVLRLPGFYHMKDPASPHLVKVVATSGEPPSVWSEIKKHFPPVERKTETNLATRPAPGTPLLKPAEIASALAVLSPDLRYGEWLKVGMALHSTGSGREAFEIWDTWSEKGRDYRNGECRYRWDTFAQGGGVTLGTLFHMAREAGWDGRIDSNQETLKLVAEQCRQMLTLFRTHHAVAMIQGKALIVYRERDQNVGRMTTRYSSQADIRLKHQNQRLPLVKADRDGKNPRVEYESLVDVWLKAPSRQTYDHLVFKPVPGMIAGETVLPEGSTLNLYQGLSVAPKEGDCRLILDHIYEIWCSNDENAYKYVCGWLARLFQKPQERGHTVIVLRSGEGTGKNIIIDILVDAFGDHATVAVKPEDLTGRFNDHLATSVLVFANEALWGGNKEHEGALKSLITDKELPVERKYVPKYRVRNCVHLIMASNNDWAAPVGLDDRRFLILDVSENRKGDREHFTRLSEQILSGGKEAFIDFLMKYDIEDFDPRVLPDLGLNQATKRDAKVRGLDSVSKWWLERLELGELPLAATHMQENSKWGFEPVSVPIRRMYDAYVEWTKVNRHRCEHVSTFGKKLSELAAVQTKRPSAASDPSRSRVYLIPPLSECQQAWERRAMMPWNWWVEANEEVAADEVSEVTQSPEPVDTSPIIGVRQRLRSQAENEMEADQAA